MFAETLAPGILLAAPTLADTFFEQSVIVLLEANDEGAMGFMVNRPIAVTLGDLATSMSFPICDDYRHDRVFVGGPVRPQRGWVFARRNERTPDNLNIDFDLGDDLIILTEVDALRALLNTPDQEFRLMLGYSGWGEEQLQEELRDGSWITHTMDADAVFSHEPAALWQVLLDTQGFDAQMFWGRPISE